MSVEKGAILEILKSRQGDNLARAWNSLKGLTYLQMWESHGESGKSGFEILSMFIKQEVENRELIDWLEKHGD
jgi:hypothetical protein